MVVNVRKLRQSYAVGVRLIYTGWSTSENEVFCGSALSKQVDNLLLLHGVTSSAGRKKMRFVPFDKVNFPVIYFHVPKLQYCDSTFIINKNVKTLVILKN